MPTVADAQRLVAAFDPGADVVLARSRERVLTLLDGSPAPFSRHQYDPGHVTASGVVLSPDGGQVLLVFHRRLGRWLQPGGHIEASDPTVVAAARREILEETSVALDQDAPPVVVGIDVHDIPATVDEPRHLHHDVTFLFLAAQTALRSADPQRVVWCPVGELGGYAVDEALRRSVERAVRRRDGETPSGF